MDFSFIFNQVRDDREALMFLSALGFVTSDWKTIVKLGGPRVVLESDLGRMALKKAFDKHPSLEPIFSSLRAKLDIFYEEQGTLLTPLDDPSLRLFRVPNAPLAFFARFKNNSISLGPRVAIVGSRAACKQGKMHSFSLAETLAKKGITVISGGASGIDEAAHLGALSAKGNTILVTGLTCSLKKDVLFLQYEKNRQNISIIYPFGPFFPQGKYMFIERNRSVVTLADALIVVQGQKGSGTLHSVNFAQRLGIPIFAVPGEINNPLSFVPNMLLASGKARALVDFSLDILSSAKVPQKKTIKTAASQAEKAVLVGEKSAVLPELLRFFVENGHAMTMPELIDKTKKPFLEIQKELLSYELSGRIVKRGPQFVLTDN